MQTRYQNKSEVGVFQKQVLTLNIFKVFEGKLMKEFELPAKYSDHEQYLQKWQIMYFYETFCYLVGEKFSQNLSWKANLVKIHEDSNFQIVSLKVSRDFQFLGDLFENDLLFLSEKPQKINYDKKPILAFVKKRAQKFFGEFDENSQVTLLLDKNAKFSKNLFVQKLEKMSTMLREYKTLRQSEFYRISPLILNP